MSTDAKAQLAAINKKVLKMHLITAPANIALGLGLFSLFVSDPGSVFPFMSNPAVGYGLLIVGGIAQLMAMGKLFPLLKEQQRLKHLVR
ncbi:hypothetical protein [Marinobacter bohaiensis]|uniref:hypothetical protein n=1 Tax=Marinobacter bohaiensis TaxID=2201898 RepID=UPI000DAD6221|nr:hypothetical protein [Marinobacter bohaiensis]